MQNTVDDEWGGFIQLYKKTSAGKYVIHAALCVACQQVLLSQTKSCRDVHRRYCYAQLQKSKALSHLHVNDAYLNRQQQLDAGSHTHSLKQMADSDACAPSQALTDVHRLQLHADEQQGAQTPVVPVCMYPPVVDLSLVSSTLEDDDVRTKEQHCYQEILQLLLQVCIFVGAEYEMLYSPIFERLLTCLNNNFTLPPVHDFNGPILQDTIANVASSNLNYEYIDTIVVVMRKSRETSGYLVLSFILAKPLSKDLRLFDEKKGFAYVYIGGIKYDMIAHEETTLSTFCDDSVKVAESKFGIKINFMMHEGIGTLKPESTVNKHKYFRFNSISDIISVLQNFNESRAGKSFIAKNENYLESLTKIRKNLVNPTYSIADGLEDLFTLLSKGDSRINDEALDHIKEQLSPFHLAANFLDYRYKGKLFSNDERLNKKVEGFVYDYGPRDAFFGFCHYSDGTDIFKTLFSQKYLSKNNFWNSTSSNSHLISLSVFAKKIINIPAAPKYFDFGDINGIFNKLHMQCTDETISLILSVLMNN